MSRAGGVPAIHGQENVNDMGAPTDGHPREESSRSRHERAPHPPRMGPFGAGLHSPSAWPTGSPRMASRPAPATHVIAVCSGKGGVGKSTIALNLAVSLAIDGLQVGLLDADVHAPDIPLMAGLKRSAPASGWQLARRGGLEHTALEPVEEFGIRLMSSGFIVAEDQALTWSADLVGLLLNQLIWSTRWGTLDFLVIDMPPGTSDVVQDIMRVLPEALAVIVVTPQDVAHLDNRRVIAALRQNGTRILGGIENVSGLHCPACQAHIALFPPVPPERSIWASDVPLLGTVPWSAAEPDPVSEPVVLTAAQSRRGVALREIANAVRISALKAHERPDTAG
jgi:ATP-binding protein involved in chromosome partitioning